MFKVEEINDGALLKFEMRNKSGELESSFTVNPYDKLLPVRMQSVVETMKGMKERKVSNYAEWVAFDEELAYIISNALGGNQEGSAFCKIAPTEQLENGQIFATVIVKEVCKAAKEYVEKRRQRFETRSFHYKKKE